MSWSHVPYNIDYTGDIIGAGVSFNGYFVMCLTKADANHLV
jgi:hypothetical protein